MTKTIPVGRKHKRLVFRGLAEAMGMSPRALRKLRYTCQVTVQEFPASGSAQILQRMREADSRIREHIQQSHCAPLLNALLEEYKQRHTLNDTKDIG